MVFLNSSGLFLASLLNVIVSLSYGSSVTEKAGYVEVRPGAHMFWLLQYSTHADGYLNRPWIIWIQGGPGISGTGYGNYMMFGPEDLEGNERLTTWVQSASIVYVDSPIDTGFSYFSNGTDYRLTVEEIAIDLIFFVQKFLEDHAEFRWMPLYIWGQSSGGRMSPPFAYHLEQAQQTGDIQCNLVGLVIGNGCVSEFDDFSGRTEMFYQMSIIDDHKRDVLRKIVDDMWAALAANDMEELGALYSVYRSEMSFPASYYDITQDPATATSMYDHERIPLITTKMMTEFRQKFDFIPDNISWKGMNLHLNSRAIDANKYGSVHHLIDRLLSNSTIQVVVYSGQYDVACSTSSQLAWIRRLTWPGVETFYNGNRTAIYAPDSNETEMFVKATDRLKFYWVMRSGHVVPVEVPEVALRMLNRIFDNTDV